MGVHDEFFETRECMRSSEILRFHSILPCYLASSFFLSSGARPVLPMGVTPEATTKCLHLHVGSTYCLPTILFLPSLSCR
jgi:hypothetical protein